MRKNTSAFIGLFLILIGGALLFREFFYFDRYFIRSFGFFILGVMGFFYAFSREPRKGLYISTIFLLVGSYYILADAGFYYTERGLNTSVYTLTAGIAFYPLFLFGKRNWKHMVFGNLLIGIGVLFLLFHFQVIPYFAFQNIIQDYWPVTLIIVGLAYLIHGLFPGKKQVA